MNKMVTISDSDSGVLSIRVYKLCGDTVFGITRMVLLQLQVLLSLAIFAAAGQVQFQPAAVPLLVRSPYFNSWVAPNVSTNWPVFWSGNRTLGWGGFIRVDGSVYEWMGAAFDNRALEFNLTQGKVKAAAKVDRIAITPTRTIYSLSAGPMRFNFTFLSPIEPQDLTLQSFPFGYVYVDAASGDGSVHDVQIYSDLSGEWLSDDSGDTINWDTTNSSSMVYHSAQRMFNDKFADSFMAHDGTLYHASLTSPGMTWQTGGHYALRAWFLTQGSLNGTKDENFREISDDFPVFAFANDLGTISSTSQPVVWAIGYVRTPVVRYMGREELQPYWTTRYSRIYDGIEAFLNDFPDAKARAESLDNKILSEAQKVTPEYVNLVSLSARQTFGGVETAVSSDGSALMFMKDVGTSGRVNPVETIYASLPAYLYINATWCRYLLEPLLQYQRSPFYTNTYAAPDLGVNYPIAQGGPADLVRSIEDSGSMLIMAWAHARFSGDQTLLFTYYDTLKKWSDYIISTRTRAFVFSGYEDADGLMAPNLTNLALKGIIGIRAMAEISYTLGRGDDANKYQDQAITWIKDWEHAANVNGHLVSSYNLGDSWGMIYNLFADKLLDMRLVSQEVYDIQDKFYISLLQSGNQFGLPFDSSVSETKSHWTMLTAATTNKARDVLLRGVYRKAIDNFTEFRVAPFPSTYNTHNRKAVSGLASPAQGAVFGLLSMSLPSKLTGLSGSTFGPNSANRKRIKLSIGAQVGIGVGVANLVSIALAFMLWCRRRNRTRVQDLYNAESRIATFFRFGKSSTRNVPVNGLGDSSIGHHIEPYTPQKNKLQDQASFRHANGKWYGSGLDRPGQTRKQADLDATSPQDVATRASPTGSKPPFLSGGVHAVYDDFTYDSRLVRNTADHVRRNILDLQSRVYGPPPSYRTNSSRSSSR